jgi:hypothetical protein
MAHQPKKSQKRYFGRIRADMQSARTHLRYLLNWDIRYRTGPIGNYPNQLLPSGDISILQSAVGALNAALQALGPIPSR